MFVYNIINMCVCGCGTWRLRLRTKLPAVVCARIRWSNEIISFGALRGSADELSRLSSSADDGVKRAVAIKGRHVVALESPRRRENNKPPLIYIYTCK